MIVLVANPHGFCAGVNMAIESLERTLKRYSAPVYVFHEIVHNKTVVDRFKKRGVIFVTTLDEVPTEATLLFSAHGVSPAIRTKAQKLGLHAIDATCPLVTKVHKEAVRFAFDGHTIFLIGHKGHDEVVGTMGEAPHAIRIIENREDIEKLDLPPETKVAFLSQTTLSVDDTQHLVEALREKFPTIIGPRKNDICYATQNRQEAVRALTPKADLVLVLGSQNSSNSQRLAEIARGLGKPAHLIDRISDIKDAWFGEVNKVLITAGASAPEDVVEESLSLLRQRFNAKIEFHSIRNEKVTFPPPKELR